MKTIKSKKALDKKIRHAIMSGMAFRFIRERFCISILYHSGIIPGVDQDVYIQAVSKTIKRFPDLTENIKINTSKTIPYHENEMDYGTKDFSNITFDDLSECEKIFYNQQKIEKCQSTHY